MIIDYLEKEPADGGSLLVHIGLQFEDEPDSLYVAELEVGGDGRVGSWKLYFNGFDCKYAFKPEEREQLKRYMTEQEIAITGEM